MNLQRNVLLKKSLLLLILILIILFPLLSPSPYLTHISILILIWSSISTAWSYMGRFGMVSLCHGAFIGIAAYITAILFNYYSLIPLVGMLIGLLAVIVVAGVSGYACFRFGIIGHYFAITTLVITELVSLVIIVCRDITGGRLGYTINSIGPLPLYKEIIYLQFVDKTGFYYLALVLLLLTLYIWRKIDKGKTMVGLTAIGDDEEASSCIGLNIVRYKTAMFVISAAITGVGGILYAQYTMYLNPITMVGAGASLSIVFKSILGGMFTLWGPTIGTLIIIAMEEYVRVFFGAEYIGWSIIGYGITIIILIIFFPQGIYGRLREVLSKRQKHRIY